MRYGLDRILEAAAVDGASKSLSRVSLFTARIDSFDDALFAAVTRLASTRDRRWSEARGSDNRACVNLARSS